MERQVSRGLRRMWMMRAFGSAEWISPKNAKFVGILSTTRDASFETCCKDLRYSSASLVSEFSLIPVFRAAMPCIAHAVLQNVSSPAPKTAGCEARICSARVVPERSMPTTNTGRADEFAWFLGRFTQFLSQDW